MERTFKVFLAVWVVLCCAAAWFAYDYIRLEGEPTYTVASRAAIVRALARSEATVLLPTDAVLPEGEVIRYLTVRGRTRLDEVSHYFITVGENFSLRCEIPPDDLVDVPGMPGYVMRENGNVYWEKDDPITPTDTIAGTPVQLRQRPGTWWVIFEATAAAIPSTGRKKTPPERTWWHFVKCF